MQELQFTSLTIDIRPKNKIVLSEFPENTFRGGIGYMFKETLCSQQNISCKNCIVRNSCTYAGLFEPQEGIILDIGYVGYPRPFVLQLEKSKQKIINSNETVRLNIFLFGKYITHFQNFITVLRKLGERGLGKNKNLFTIDRITTQTSLGLEQILYDDVTDAIVNAPEALTISKLLKNNKKLYISEIELEFITPVHLVKDGKYSSTLSFTMLVESILKRYQSLLYFHQGSKDIFPKYEMLLDLSTHIQSNICLLQKQGYGRFSTRQKQTIKLTGVIGRMRYTGNLAPFLTLLRLRQILHIGQYTVLGFGQYNIRLVDWEIAEAD